MIKCQLCGVEYVNNLGGALTIHLKKVHLLSLADYVVLTDLNGVEPRCACGTCNERPLFYRGKFSKYAMFHKTYPGRQKRYIEMFGKPVCIRCGSDVEFYRGEPRLFCSVQCAMIGKGFGNPKTQKKIKEVIFERYGVDHNLKVPLFREKYRISNIGKHSGPKSEAHKRAIGMGTSKKWTNPEYRKRVSTGIHLTIMNNPIERKRRSDKMLEQLNDPQYREALWAGHKNRISKLHLRWRNLLKLDELGFVSEQQIGRCFADELHVEKKIVIEINGNYVHANPKSFQSNEIIRLRGNSYTAGEKWEYDAKRTLKLEKLGYRVLSIWESDDIENVKMRLNKMLKE